MTFTSPGPFNMTVYSLWLFQSIKCHLCQYCHRASDGKGHVLANLSCTSSKVIQHKVVQSPSHKIMAQTFLKLPCHAQDCHKLPVRVLHNSVGLFNRFYSLHVCYFECPRLCSKNNLASALNLWNPGCLALWFLWKKKDFLVAQEQKFSTKSYWVPLEHSLSATNPLNLKPSAQIPP